MNGAPTRVLPALLAIVALFAGWRTLASTRQVLQGGSGTPREERQAILNEEAAERMLLSRVVADDSLLKALDKAGKLPDPFNPRPPEVAVKPKVEKPPDKPLVVLPTVAFAAVSLERPEVILRLGSRESPRLRKGDGWEGWSIVRIDRDVVEIEGYEQKAYLRVPN